VYDGEVRYWHHFPRCLRFTSLLTTVPSFPSTICSSPRMYRIYINIISIYMHTRSYIHKYTLLHSWWSCIHVYVCVHVYVRVWKSQREIEREKRWERDRVCVCVHEVIYMNTLAKVLTWIHSIFMNTHTCSISLSPFLSFYLFLTLPYTYVHKCTCSTTHFDF